jgi:protein-S-isoprenylcysteine O-methyltransferase Ste14
MAKQLNRRRLLYTKLGLVAVLLLSLFSYPTFVEGQFMHGALDMVGSVLVGACALGRLYATAFLGGHKNQNLIVDGPFSMVRNPLYFFSFVGVCGVVLISNHLTFMLVVPPLFLSIYLSLIVREEVFLKEHFGEAYVQYCAATPRIWPKLSLYRAAESVQMQPKFMVKALRDSILWLSILPLFELIEELQQTGMVAVVLHIP